MGLQPLHDNGEERRIVVVELGNQPADMAAMLAQAFVLEEGALERHRPALSDHPDIGQSLLDADPTGRPLDQEHEVEIAVADLGDAPIGRGPAEARNDLGQLGEEVRQRALIERAIPRWRFERHIVLPLSPGHLLSSARRRRKSKRRHRLVRFVAPCVIHRPAVSLVLQHSANRRFEVGDEVDGLRRCCRG